ncbi:radical SAM protein [Clostridium sp. KNHs214]|uniref:radical SAM/SPASM domain-containing protein n=1 Tax=Clostridium sp. KNHs214 TaxID=1540257 RepID=UPI00055419A6|nr:radical SAM protein [Clostridium sp. KNHs214]
MKQSKYNVKFNIEADTNILYNTLSRKYVIYNDFQKNVVDNLLQNLNKDRYELKEATVLKQLLGKGILIKDDFDELEEIKFNECASRFGDQVFYLTIQPTLDCNFRCTYCYEEHKKLKMDDCTTEKVLKFVDNITKRVKRLEIGWFGGEPTLEFKRIIELTNKFKDICKKNGCEYKAWMTTNGYLFSDKNIEIVDKLSIEKFQITLDGPQKCHDKQRPLINGEGTFNKVKENILKLLSKDVRIILRINVTKDNSFYITELFEQIPRENRKDIELRLSNLMQEREKMNLYNVYKNAIDNGFKFYHTMSIKNGCEASCKASFTIEPDGKICSCSTAAENGLHFGKLTEDGNIKLENRHEYYKFKNTSALNSEQCKKCIQLPMCMGGCTYSRFNNPNICNGLVPDGLSLEDKIRLHYYSDLKHSDIRRNKIV